MKILVIGGTRFVGHHLVMAALAAGHQVTLFNRGLSGQAPAGVQSLVGDRRAELSALDGGHWDAVVDCCGYLPGEVARMAQRLQGRVDTYVFISSVSVYASAAAVNDEHSALGQIEDGDTDVVDGRTYGPLKALCEAEVTRHFGGSGLLLRPGLVVGPRDPTQRFTYWPARIARALPGERVLAPGRPDVPLQFIDARDLAGFVLLALDQGLRGPFNVVSEAGRLTMDGLLRTCMQVAGTQPRLHWVSMSELVAQGLAPWTDLPLALPDDGEHSAFMRVDARRALSAGLLTRPMAATVSDTLGWFQALPAEQQHFERAGLSPAREAAVLAALQDVGWLAP